MAYTRKKKMRDIGAAYILEKLLKKDKIRVGDRHEYLFRGNQESTFQFKNTFSGMKDRVRSPAPGNLLKMCWEAGALKQKVNIEDCLSVRGLAWWFYPLISEK